MKTLPFFLAFLFLYTVQTSVSQDTLWLSDGMAIPVGKYRLLVEEGDSLLEYYDLKGKKKLLTMDGFYFAGNGTNLLFAGDIRPEEVLPRKQFSLGMEKALQNFKPGKCMTSGLAIGFASAFLPPLSLPVSAFESFYYSPLIPMGFGIFLRNVQIMDYKTVAEAKQFSANEDFVSGYREGVQKKRARNMIWGSVLGFASGLAVYGILQ